MPTRETIEEARKHFEKGYALAREQAWAASLAEFLVSLDLFPTRPAVQNAAHCYMMLQRYAEALDTYERLLRDYPSLPADIKEEAQKAVTELRGRVGTIDVTGAERGATIVVSGQSLGEYPLPRPLRVGAGAHVLRVFKEGFEPFQKSINVAGGQTVLVEAKLTKLTSAGRLKVTEQGGRILEVVVDTVVMGNTPWEGQLSVGNHVVTLREHSPLGRFGTQPVNAAVKGGDVTTLSLRAQELDSALRIEPRPPGAAVFINGVKVGEGQWVGRLVSGKHKIEVYEEGFKRAAREVTLPPGGREIVSLELDRDEDAPRWQKPSKWVADVSVGLAVALGPGLGGDIARSCTEACTNAPALGPMVMAHGARERGTGLGGGVSAGYLFAFFDQRQRATPLLLQPEGQPNGTKLATVNESLKLHAALLGLHGSYRFDFGWLPVTARLAIGVAVGHLRAERNGASVPSSDGATAVLLAPTAVTNWAVMPFAAPEVHVGWRFAHVEATLGLRALLSYVVPPTPHWQNDQPIYLDAGPGYGAGRYSDETLTGEIVVLFGPTLGIRYDR